MIIHNHLTFSSIYLSNRSTATTCLQLQHVYSYNYSYNEMSGILRQIAQNPTSVHITMSPVPGSIGSSKQILAALQKFGEIATFRNLKVSLPFSLTFVDKWLYREQPREQDKDKAKKGKQYDTSNTSPKHASHAIAIYDTAEAARRAISCRRVTISRPESRIPCTCTIEPSHHNHESSLRRNPYHRTFEIEKDSTYRDLVRSGVPLRELADGRTRSKGFVSRGVTRSVQAENVRWGATSLWGLFEGNTP